ncbi:MAG: fumarylacetoacetate hydrolase family protein [Bacteroidales bacterium]|nr:fumarylacetoacetate hydrolase family protein [Bacteroidales bacterium]
MIDVNIKSFQEIADILYGVYESKTPCGPIADFMESKSIEEAYKIQDINTNRWISEGRTITGRKIGLTSPAVQKQLGVDQPDFGILFADMAYNSGETVDYSKLVQPKAEAEIALVLKKDLNKSKHQVTDILSAIDFVLPAVEIVASRIANWKISIYDTIADNASSGLFTLGTKPVDPADVDWELCGMTMFREGEPVSTGAGMACMGNPLNAAVWLADKMVEMNRPLKEGEIILTGALGPMVNVNPGDVFTAMINSVGEVKVVFSNG